MSVPERYMTERIKGSSQTVDMIDIAKGLVLASYESRD